MSDVASDPVRGRAPRAVGADPGMPIAREQESALLLRLIDDPTVRLVTVTGISGAGKSLLAAHVARAVTDRRTWTTAMVTLSWVTSSAAAIPMVADALAGVPSVHGRVAAQSGALLVLDGAQCLSGQAAYLSDLLAGRPDLTLLVTSTAPMRVAGEQVVRLDPLPAPAPSGLSTAELARIGSVRLFIRCLQQSGRVVEDDDLPSIAALCHRMGGLPLAVELATAASVQWGVAGVLARVDGGDGLVDLRRRGAATARHRSLADALAFTCNMLAPADRALLDALAVFHGPFGIEAAGAVGGLQPSDELGERLSALVDARVLDPIGNLAEQPLFVLPPLIRDFERDRAPAAALDRHADYVAAQCRQASAEFVGGRQAAALRRLASIWAEVGPACDRVARRPDPVAALEMAVDAAPHLWAVGLEPEGARRLARLTKTARADPALPAGVLARALIWRAILGRDDPLPGTAQGQEPVGLLTEGLALASACGDVEAQLLGLEFRSVLPSFSPDRGVSDARRAAEQGLALAIDTGDERRRSRFLAWLGMLADRRGELALALRYCEEALRVARCIGDEPAVVVAARQLLAMPSGWGVPDLPTVDELLAAARRSQDNRDLMLLQSTAGFRAIMAGQFTAGAALTLQSLQLVSDLGAAGSSTAAVLMTNVLVLAVRRGDLVDAARLAGALSPVTDRLVAALPWWKRSVLREMLASLPELTESPDRSIAAATGMAMEYLGRMVTSAPPDPASVLTPATGEDGPVPPVSLTPRQRDVLAAIATGRTNKEIALMLNISVKTVMHHTVAVYATLGVRGRTEATAWAVRNGLADG